MTLQQLQEIYKLFLVKRLTKVVIRLLAQVKPECWDSAGNISAPVWEKPFIGQDAQFTHTAPVYTKSSDGLTVKDEVTGLTWQKTYEKPTFGGMYYWAETQTEVDNLNKQNYGGYNDWRVPTIKELYSLWNEVSDGLILIQNILTLNIQMNKTLVTQYSGVATNIPE